MKKLLLIGALGMVAAASNAAVLTLTFDLTNTPSFDGLYDPDNASWYGNLDTVFGNDYSYYLITDIAWDNIVITTIAPGSWCSDSVISAENTAGTNYVDLTPSTFDAEGTDGPLSSGGWVNLGANSVAMDADDMMFVHLWEAFDEAPDAVDNIYQSGTVTYQLSAVDPVPEPATFAVLGLGALALIRRRKVSK